MNKLNSSQKSALGILTLLISLTSLTPVNGAPAQDFFVVNENTNECSIFWPGDEFSKFELPLGWEILEEVQIVFEEYKCAETEGNPYKYCCEKLGYEFKEFTGRGIKQENLITEKPVNKTQSFLKQVFTIILSKFKNLFNTKRI